MEQKTSNIETSGNSELTGIVLIGGHSKRMGIPKAGIIYNGEKLAIRTARLLNRFTEEVYFSGREDQLKLIDDDSFPFIADRYNNIGPLAGLLSAFEKTKNLKGLLVTATDMPFLDEATVKRLIAMRNPQKIATMYIHKASGFLEPLCAIYELKAYQLFLDAVSVGDFSIHKILKKEDLNLIPAPQNKTLSNLNYPDQLDELT
jgi:molybdopterin-guanine dinucleotide biosynthesis protein A